MADAVRMMLTFEGHEVVTARNAQEALALFEPGKIDLVITDYAMPGMKETSWPAAYQVRVRPASRSS